MILENAAHFLNPGEQIVWFHSRTQPYVFLKMTARKL